MMSAAAEGRERELLLVDELPVDPRALSVRQHLRRDVQRIRIRIAVEGDVMGDDHRRQRPVLFQLDAPLLRLRRLLRNVARHRAVRSRHAPEIPRHQLLRLLRLEVSDEHQRRVVRHVVGPEEIADVGDRRGLEILHAADRRVLVGVDRERLVVDELVQPAVRLVVDAHPALFLDDLPLVLEHVLFDAQRREAIGFEPQHQRQVLRRHRLPEDRRVFVGVGVALPADARDPRRMPLGLDVLRALEHHVLEQVREAGAAGTLVLGPDVVPHFGVHDRRGVILEEHHLQPVRQRRHRVIELGRPRRRARARVRRHERGERHQHGGKRPARSNMTWVVQTGFKGPDPIMARDARLGPGNATSGVTPARPGAPRGRRWSCAAPAAAGTRPTTSATSRLSIAG